MTGIQALAMTLELVKDGIDPNEAAEISIETMNAINSLESESFAEAA